MTSIRKGEGIEHAQHHPTHRAKAFGAYLVQRIFGSVPVVILARGGAILKVNQVNGMKAGLNKWHMIVNDGRAKEREGATHAFILGTLKGQGDEGGGAITRDGYLEVLIPNHVHDDDARNFVGQIALFQLCRELPTPVQAIVGAVIGIGLLKRGRGIRWRTLGGIASGWALTPILAGIFSLVALFFLQNVFQQSTYQPISYQVTPAAMARINAAGISTLAFDDLAGKNFDTAVEFSKQLKKRANLKFTQRDFILSCAEIGTLSVSPAAIAKMDSKWFSIIQLDAIKKLRGRSFAHKWQLHQALADDTPAWRFRKNDKNYNEELNNRLAYLYSIFR